MNNLEKETMEMAKRAARKFVYDEINWEQRRYEIAKEMLPMVYNKLVTLRLSEDTIDVQGLAAAGAIEYADALIKELKGGKPCE